MTKFLENFLIVASSIFLVYVGRDHFVATTCLIIATRTVCFLVEQQKRSNSAATEIDQK